jgi:hypothetical protein
MEGPAASIFVQRLDSAAVTRARLQERLSEAVRRQPVSSIFPCRQDVSRILLLILLTAVLRIWVLQHTVVAARDSIGFIRYALSLESSPWQTLVHELQHPGYPIAILLVSWPVRLFMGVTPVSMQLAAQLVSVLASLLLVIPMYFLGRELHDRRAGFWGTAIFQCLPAVSHIMADGLSEAVYFLFVATMLLAGVRAVRTSSPWRFGLCGMCSGLAYLVRPEGAVGVVAITLVLLAMQTSTYWRRRRDQLALCLASLFVGAALIGGPYALIIRGFTNKPTPNSMIPAARTNIPAEDRQVRSYPSMLLAIYAPEGMKSRFWWGPRAILTEVAKGYQYLASIPVLLGIIWYWSRVRSAPGAWILVTLCALHALILWRLAVVGGYVSERHVLLIVLCGSFWGAAAVDGIGQCLASFFRTKSAWPSIVLLAGLTAFGVPDALRTLHANRAGDRAAGYWLADHSGPQDQVFDPFCWAHYYAGRVFTEGQEPRQSEDKARTIYVVLEHSDHEHVHLPTLGQATELAKGGKPVYWWPVNGPQEQAKVCVYAVNR